MTWTQAQTGEFSRAWHAKKNIVARLAIYVEWSLPNVVHVL